MRIHKGPGPGGVEVARQQFESDEYCRPKYRILWVHLRIEQVAPSPIPTLHPTVLFHAGQCGGPRDALACSNHVGLVRWSAQIAPGCLEGYFSVAVERIGLDWDMAQWEVRHFFEPMLEPYVVLGPIAHLLIALGIVAKEAGQTGMAIDALVTAFQKRPARFACPGRGDGTPFGIRRDQSATLGTDTIECGGGWSQGRRCTASRNPGKSARPAFGRSARSFLLARWPA
ncbi:MAG: hypothetical protein ACI841_000006 [Planctomycetota bacterium]|jgi:hypothetical protein